MGRTLVLSGETRHGLVAIRELARAGVTVTAGSSSTASPARFSRHTDRFLRYPDPRGNIDGFVETVADELRDGEYTLLLPVSGETVEPVAENRDVFEEHATVPFPPTERFRIGYDKARTMEAAAEVGVSHPKTVRPDEVGLDGVLSKLDFPMVVKPRSGRSRMGVSVCDAPDELVDAVDWARVRHGPVIVQSFIPNGGERGVYALYNWENELRGVTVQKRIRSNHPVGGPSTLRETVDDPELVEQTDRLLSSLDWEGVAMAEYRIDPHTREPHLVEINPRLWGSLRLTVTAGMNAPVMLHKLAEEGTCDPALDYERGVRAHWVFGDAFQVLTRENRLSAAGEFLGTVSAHHPRDVISRSDPLPAVTYGLGGLYRRVLK